MKNLLIYLNPREGFDSEYNDSRMAEVQIDSALQFWKPEDILFVTNFPYEYHGVRAMVVGDELYDHADATGKASKVDVIVHLLENNLLPDLTWFHDLDAFQMQPIDITLEKDLGLTTHGHNPKWNTGSFFFKPAALDVFKWLKDEVYRRRANEQPVLWILTKYNVNNINSRYQVLNITYNLGMRHLDIAVPMAQKPIRVAHFPPHWKDAYESFIPIITPELKKIIDEKFYPDA